LPADDAAGTVVTARALTITARDSDTRCPGTAGLKCGESVLTGESLPAGKRHRASQAHEDQVNHPYRHEPAILPAKRQARQANPQVSPLCHVLEPHRTARKIVGVRR
jgi:hypothetical protein